MPSWQETVIGVFVVHNLLVCAVYIASTLTALIWKQAGSALEVSERLWI
jgi:hypothetical protein